MSDDGADIGFTAEDGMKAALGAEQDEMPTRTPLELLDEIRRDAGDTYSGCANRIALGILRVMEQRPETQQWPADPEGTFFIKGTDDQATQEQLRTCDFNLLEYRRTDDRNLCEAFKATATSDELAAYGSCTGFMWGWAVNAAKYIMGAPPVPNPAIMTIG